MNSLYEIGRQYLDAINSLNVDEETGEITSFDAIEALSGQFEEKAESVACYIKNLESFSTALKNEEDNLSSRRRSSEKKIDSLKRYLTSCLDMAGSDKLETAKCKVGFRKSVAVNIENKDILPAQYVVVTEQRMPDKTAIKKAIQSGECVSGASLVENRNIQIK